VYSFRRFYRRGQRSALSLPINKKESGAPLPGANYHLIWVTTYANKGRSIVKVTIEIGERKQVRESNQLISDCDKIVFCD
jgi:hypothetical protein